MQARSCQSGLSTSTYAYAFKYSQSLPKIPSIHFDHAPKRPRSLSLRHCPSRGTPAMRLWATIIASGYAWVLPRKIHMKSEDAIPGYDQYCRRVPLIDST